MDSNRWERLQSLFHTAAGLPGEEQPAFLEAECGAEKDLANEVLAMLAQDRYASGLIDAPLGQIAADLIGDPATLARRYREIGLYRIERILGEGGMGTVFLGVRVDLGSFAAIKILRDAWISPARRERFALEQRTLAQLDHPNIARLLDADTLPDGTPFFVMEYVDGLPLDQYCEREACSIPKRLQLFRSVCEAVQFAHDHAVIHRDLKPSNILVKPGGAVKLLDFGVARHLDDLDPAANLTRTGLRLLTPAYASPEQLRGEPSAIQTDIYSLGVILYQLLTQRLPFDISGRSPVEAASILMEHDPVSPSMVARRVIEHSPPGHQLASVSKSAWLDLDVLCLTAMHRDVKKRYASASALMRDVDHYLQAEPLDARPDTPGYRLGKFVRRHRRSLAGSAAGFAAITALILFFIVRLASERNAALAEAARTQRIQRFLSNLFQGGDEDAGPASEMRVATLLDRGVQEAKSLDRDPVVQAELYQTLGEVYQKLGRFDQAETSLTEALRRRRSLPPQNAADISESLVGMGLLRIDQARLDEAEKLVRQGLENARKNAPDHPIVAAATDALGRVLEEKGDYNQSISVLEEAVRLRSGPNASPADLSSSLYELANVYFYAGRYKEAEALNNRVLAIDRQLYGERHPRVAEALINLGAIQQQLGYYSQAEQFHRRALDITRSFYGEDHQRTASARTLLARTLIYEKRHGEAVDLLNEALATQERVYGKVHPRVASALNELGSVALTRGQYEEAAGDFQRVINIYTAIHSGRHYTIGIGLANLASVHMASGDNPGAEQLFRKALEMFEQTLPADHMEIAISRIKLGRTLLRSHRYEEAKRESEAGYLILKKQSSPSIGWLKNAQTDLTQIYSALKQTEKAEAFRSEMAAAVPVVKTGSQPAQAAPKH